MANVPRTATAGQQTANRAAVGTDTANLPAVIRPFQKAFSLDTTQLALIKRTVCPPGTTDDEMALFFHECRRRGTHPMDRLIVMTKFKSRDDDEEESGSGSKVVMMTTIDYLRAQAQLPGDYAGTDAPKFGPTIKFQAERISGKGANAKSTRNVIDVPEFAIVRAYKQVGERRVPIEGIARWSEFYPGHRRGGMWQKFPFNMLAKCAEAQALRKGWPQQLRRLYSKEELDQAFAAEDAKPVGRSRTAAADRHPEPRPPQEGNPQPDDLVTDIHDAETITTPPAERWLVENLIAGKDSKEKEIWKAECLNGDNVRDAFYTRDKAFADTLERFRLNRTVFTLAFRKNGKIQELTELAPLAA